MSTLAWVTMAIICTTVWGGFLTLLVRALRFENRRFDDQDSDSRSDAAGAGGDR